VNKPSTCLVTGAAGFIGSHLVDRLLAGGSRVIGIDDLSLGTMKNLEAASAHERFVFAKLDLNDLSSCEKFVAGQLNGGTAELVWHMAANSDISAGVNNPEIDLKATFLTTYNVVQLMHRLGLGRLAFASSSAIYGDHKSLLSEETGPLFPISNYGAMKLASEGVISAAVERFLEQAWIFRFPNVVGGRATHGVIFDFLKKLRKNSDELEVLGDGSQEKPYLHVSDLIDAMLFISQNAHSKLNCFNIAPTSATTVRHIAEATVAVVAPGAKLRYTGGNRGWVGDVPKFAYSVDKLHRLGWHPRFTSNQAVETAIRENHFPAVARPSAS
jgi:UDP-glucose 4-epimerase